MTDTLQGLTLARPILVVLLCITGSVSAQPGERPSATLHYRRVYVPQADIDQFTRDHKLMRREKFSELIDKIHRRTSDSRDDAAWIQSADYSAVFTGGELTGGKARLNVVHTAVDASVLLLSPCQLALGQATWQGAEVTEDAIVGNSLDGKLVALVHDSGVLEFPWTLGGKTNQWGETSFDVVLAPAPMNRLTVDLPTGFHLLANRGIVSQIDHDPSTAIDQPANTQRWVIQLGGTHRLQLVVASEDAMRQRAQLVSVQQDTLYRLSDDGLEVDCNVELDIQREPLEVLLFRVEPELQVTSVRLGNRDVSWSLAGEPDGRSRQLQVRFAEPLSGVHRTLKLSAIGPLRTGETWRLPQFRPQDTFWRQGTMSLALPDSLGLRHLTPHDARYSTSTPDLTAQQFELFSPQGFLEINVVRTEHQLTGTVGTTIDLEPGTMTAQIAADLSCDSGQHFLLEADLPSTWMIDGIESDPATSLEDHQYVAYEAKSKRLQIRLAEPLMDEPLRLTIRAHRTPTLALQADDFRPVRFRNLTNATRLVAIAPDPNFRLDLSGDVGVVRLDPEELPAAQAELIKPRNGGVVFRDDQQADTMTVQVTSAKPSYTAENYVRVEITSTSLTESFQLVCKPEATSISRLYVLLSEPRPEPIAWSLKANGNSLLSAKKLDGDQNEAPRFSQTGELWELVLRNLQDEPFEILGTRKTPFRSAEQVSLATLPDATSQEGWLSITSLDGSTMSIKANAVKPIPNVFPQPEQCPVARARYRYDVSPNAQVLVDHVDRRNAPAPLWAWHCSLNSQLLDDGKITHRATYLLESAGGSDFQFRLPPNCVLINIDVNGSHVARPGHTQSDHSYSVTLPPSGRFPRVTIAYSSPQHEYRLFDRIAARLPDVDVPVLDRRWTLWLAPGLKPIPHRAGVLREQPATWAQRLLGPLAATPNNPPFQLFSVEHWTSLVSGSSVEGPSSAYGRLFLQLLGEQYLELRAASSSKEVAWRDLMESYHRRSTKAELAPEVWIDAGRLADDGFDLEHSIDVLRTGTPIQVASELLSRERLVAVSHDDLVMITSLDGLTRTPASIQVTRDPALAGVYPNSRLARELESLVTWRLDGIFPLQAWIAQPAASRVPWQWNRSASRLGIAGRNWRACEVVLDAEGQGSMTVIRTRALGAIGWAVLLTTTGVGAWLGTYRSRLLLPMLISAAVLAMLVPSTWIPLTANLLLGTVLSSLVLAVRHLILTPRVGAGFSGPEDSSPGVAANVSLSILAALLTLATHSVRAEDNLPASDSIESSHVHQVIVPVDDDLKPVGDCDYLPTEFYNVLLRAQAESTSSPQNWLVRCGNYRAVFNWTRQRSSLDLTSLTVEYELELFKPLQRIEFPWDGNDPSLQILEAQLAGQPIELNWNNDRSAFFITVPSEGLTPLEIVLLPTTTDERGERGLRFKIPPLSRSQLHIEAPIDAPEVEVVSAVGGMGESAIAGERIFDLGPVRTFVLRWSGPANQLDSRQLSVQQLSWVKVRPKDHTDSVILDTTFRIESSGIGIEQVSLRTDPRLIVRDGEQSESYEIDESGLRDGNGSRLIVRLRDPTERDITLRLQFWVLNTTGLGNISLPRVEILDGRVERRWLALSVGPDLDFTAGHSDSFAPMDAAEFLAVWGEAEQAPSLCYRMDADDPTWSISTRSRQARSQAQQRLDISIGHTVMHMELDADINTSDGTIFQHGFSVPRGFRVTEVSVIIPRPDEEETEGIQPASTDQSIPAVAEHDGTGNLTLFLSQGVSGPHHVKLRGELDVPAIDTDIPIPELTLQNATVMSSIVRIYRQVNVLVSMKEVVQSDGAVRRDLGRFRKDYGRLIAVQDVSEGPADGTNVATILIRPNKPTVNARLVTTLRRADDTWEAIAQFEAAVTNASAGVVDQFRFEIPDEWTDPFVLEPAMPYQIVPVPGPRRHLVVRPQQPITDRFQVRIRGSLVLGVNERARTPNIVPLDVVDVDRFFVLPTQLDQQQIHWETSGLRRVSLQEAMPNGRADTSSHVAFAVYARPRAVIADVLRVAKVRQISLADVHVRCHADGSCFGTVMFEIEPAGMGSCTLEVPSHCELIQATVEGVPATLIPLANRRWHVRLVSEQLPQQLAVLFRGRLPRPLSRTAQPARVPWIADFDVVRTLWTIHGPRSLIFEGNSLEEHRVTAVAQESIRLRSTASLVESAVETVLDSPATEIKSWYTPWAIRLACSNARLARDRQLSSDQSPMAPNAVDALNDRQELLGQRLNVSPRLKDYQTQTARYAQPNDLMQFMPREDDVTQLFAFIGQVPAVSVSRHTSRLPSWWKRALGAILISLLGCVVYFGTRCAPVVAWLCQWPYAIGVLMGLTWWLFASPSVLGWAIVAVSLWCALRLPMPSRRVRTVSADPPPTTAV